jgi:capsular exopolysaccharide synthesis family protein
VDFRTFVKIILARWKIVIAAMLVCLIGAVVATALQPKKYEATATVLMSFSGVMSMDDAFKAVQTSGLRMSTYAEIAGGHSVAQQAVDQLGVPMSADELTDETKVVYQPDSTSFQLSVVDSDPQRAASLAGAMADQFTVLLPKLEASVEGLSNTSAVASVIERPAVPYEPFSPKPLRNIAFGLVAGALLGTALALVRSVTDRALRTREDVDSISGVPSLAELPRSNGRGAGKHGSAVGRFGSGNAFTDEALRSFRTRFLRLDGPGPHSVLLTGPVSGEGTTTTALNLALAFGELGGKVLLIEGDPRKAEIAGRLGVEGSGLSEVLANRDTLDSAIQVTSNPNLWVLAGRATGTADPRYGTPGLAEVMEKLSAVFDHVIVDGPPVLATADAGLLAAACQSTLLVVRAKRTTADEVEEALYDLRAAGGNVVGTVLTSVPISRHSKAVARAYNATVGESG